MATLHMVSTAAALAPCLEVAADDDTILLLGNGVYAAVTALAPSRALLALQADVTARGLGRRLGQAVREIDEHELVTLAVAHEPIVSWR